MESVQQSPSPSFNRLHGIQHGKLYKSSGIVAPNSTIPTKYQTVIVSNADKSGFASSSRRFQYEMDENVNPGPGSYGNLENFLVDKPSHSLRGMGGLASKTRRKTQLSDGSASVLANYVALPSQLQSRKDFNRATVSRNFHTDIAIHREKMGKEPSPNKYNLADYRPRKTALVDAGFAFKSKTKRELLTNNDAKVFPGPNQYNREKADKLVMFNTTEGISSSFKSKSERKLLDDNNQFPGPSAYHPYEEKRESADRRRNNVRQHYLCLSAPALPLPPTPPLPGPGQYNMVEYERPKHFMSSSVFLSNASRWGAQGLSSFNENLPGPAQYHPSKPGKQNFIYNSNRKWI